MKTATRTALAALAFAGMSAGATAGKFEERWVFAMGNLREESMWPGLSNAVVQAAAQGMNGILWSAGMAEVDTWPAEQLARAEKMKSLCREYGLEIIPGLWPTAGGVARYHPELGEATPAAGMRFVRRGAEARFVPESPIPLDAMNGERFAPKTVVEAKVSVKKDSVYRVSMKVRTDDFTGAPRLSLRVFQQESWAESRAISPTRFKQSQDWTEVSLTVQSIIHDQLTVRLFSSTKGATGTFSVKDAQIERVAPTRVSAEFPARVVGASSGASFAEGRDFVVVPGRGKAGAMTLKIPEGSAIAEGEELLVDVQIPVEVVHQSTPLCFTHPGREAYYRRSAEGVKRILNPRRWFLYCDEIRAGGLCPRCRASGKDMAHLVAEDVKLQCDAIRAVCPDAVIYSWSDMFDPMHNARERYFAMASSLLGIWDLLPKDLVISCWREERGEKSSVAFFDKLGFRTQAALYYDDDTLDITRRGLEAMRGAAGCRGVMYTTWRKSYDMLPAFCDMVRRFEGGGGTTFDFKALSHERVARLAAKGGASIVAEGTPWALKAEIHSRSLPKKHELRRTVDGYVRGTLEDGEMRIATDASYGAAAAAAGIAPGTLSGAYETRLQLPGSSGGVYRVSFDYMMTHSADNKGGFLIWQYDAAGKTVGKLKVMKLVDFDDDFIPFSSTFEALPGAVSLRVSCRIYGIGELRMKNIRLAPEVVNRPFETMLAVMGSLDGTFAVGEGQMGALCFGWRQTDDTKYDRRGFSFELDLPAGFEYLGNSFARQADAVAAPDGSTTVKLLFNTKYDGKLRRNYGPFKYLGVAVRARPGARRGDAVFRLFHDGREMAEPCRFRLEAVPPVAGTAPKRLMGGYDLGGAYATYDSPEARKAFADLTVAAGMRCLVLSGDTEAIVPALRAAGVSRILASWSGCCNGYVLDAKCKDIPEEARFKVRDPEPARASLTSRGICPQEIYGEGPFFTNVFLPALKEKLKGADGLWANWEPYIFNGQGCACARCEAKRAAFAGEDHDFRSKEHAKVVKTVDKWVRRFTDAKTTMGFLPGVSAKQMTTGWRRVYGRSEFKEYDYAASLEWIEPWGPYVYWDSSTPYAKMMHPTVLTFAAAKNVREMTDADYGEKAPKLMAYPQGTQGASWVTQPEYLGMAYDAHFFNRWHACLAYYFPRGYDARYWKAVADAMTRAARYEDFILDGARCDGKAFAVPPEGYPVCRKPEEYLDGVENVSLLQSVAYELNGELAVAVFNYYDDRACRFRLCCRGLAEGKYRLVDEAGADYGVKSAADLAAGVELSISPTRTLVFEVRKLK